MKNDKRTITLMIIAIGLIITVGYALLTQQLNIEGQATVKGAGWLIKFENLISSPTIVGTAEEEETPELNSYSTVISGIDVTLKAPGDSVTYTFDIANKGGINAEITDLIKSTMTCTSTTDRAADEAIVCGNIEYTLTYGSGTVVAVGDELNAGATKTAKLKISYPVGSLMPADDVTVTNITYAIVYSQK